MTEGSDQANDDQALLERLLAERPWRGPSYTLSCGIYYGLMTIMAVPLCFAFTGPQTPSATLIAASLAIGVILDVMFYRRRARVLSDEVWLASARTGLSLGVQSYGLWGLRVKLAFGTVYVLFWVAVLVAYAVLPGWDISEPLVSSSVGKALHVFTLAWVLIASFYPPIMSGYDASIDKLRRTREALNNLRTMAHSTH